MWNPWNINRSIEIGKASRVYLKTWYSLPMPHDSTIFLRPLQGNIAASAAAAASQEANNRKDPGHGPIFISKQLLRMHPDSEVMRT